MVMILNQGGMERGKEEEAAEEEEIVCLDESFFINDKLKNIKIYHHPISPFNLKNPNL